MNYMQQVTVLSLQFAAMLVATAEDCKQKSLKRLARDDESVPHSVPHSSLNTRQTKSRQVIHEPDNLKVP